MSVFKTLPYPLFISMLLLFIFTKNLVQASDIQSFGYLGSEGSFGFNYLDEDYFTQTTAGNSNNQETRTFQEDLNLQFHTFIYHPNFLKFDIGLGLIFAQDTVKTFEIKDGIEVAPYPSVKREDSAGLNYDFLFSFLEKKDYPFTVFYSKNQPNLRTTVVNGFSTELTRYGFDLTWNAPVTIKLRAVRNESKGTGYQLVIDDESDSTSLTAYKAFKNSGYLNVGIDRTESISKTGADNTIIVPIERIKDSVFANSVHNFGSADKYTLTLNGSFERERKSVEYDNLNLNTRLRWKHSQKAISNYLYDYNRIEYADFKTVNQVINTDLALYINKHLSNTTDLSFTRNEVSETTINLRRFNNNTTYTTPFKGGSFALSAGLGISDSDTSSTSDEVKDFQLIKLDITHVSPNKGITLNRQNIIESSIVVKSQFDSNITFILGTHYDIKNINGRITINVRNSQVAGAGILEGNTKGNVSVEFRFDPGVSNEFETIFQTITTRLDFLSHLYVSGGFYDQRIKQINGTLATTETLNRNTVNYGVGIDYPLFDLALVGARLEREKTTEDSLRIDGQTRYVYVQMVLFSRATLHLSRSDVIQDYQSLDNRVVTSGADVDKVVYNAMLKFQPSIQTNLSFIYDDSTDVGIIDPATGEVEPRKYTESKVVFAWRYRRIDLQATGSIRKEQNNKQIFERSTIYLNMTRTF